MMTIHFRAVNYTADIKLKEFTKERIKKLSQFYNQIIGYNKSNENILVETRKRLNRDFSE